MAFPQLTNLIDHLEFWFSIVPWLNQQQSKFGKCLSLGNNCVLPWLWLITMMLNAMVVLINNWPDHHHPPPRCSHSFCSANCPIIHSNWFDDRCCLLLNGAPPRGCGQVPTNGQMAPTTACQWMLASGAILCKSKCFLFGLAPRAMRLLFRCRQIESTQQKAWPPLPPPPQGTQKPH